MKKYFKLFLMLIIVLVGCNESATEPEVDPGEKETVDYSTDARTFFSTDIGDIFSYNVDTMNTKTKNFESIGTRLVNVDNMGSEEESNIYICNETHNIFNNAYNSQSKFSITENSIDFFVDTSGVYDLIPDSVEIEIKLVFDKVFKLVEFPYLDKNEFQVFNAGANFGTFKFNVISIVGQYAGSDLVYLDGFESGINSEKFQYNLSINIPDISNPFASNVQVYKANVWFAPTIGIVKLEGSKMFVNPITGGRFDIADSNKVVRHTLLNYDIN